MSEARRFPRYRDPGWWVKVAARAGTTCSVITVVALLSGARTVGVVALWVTLVLVCAAFSGYAALATRGGA